MAQIFLACHEGTEKSVALKLFRRQLLETARITVNMFLTEARLCANLNHPNIVQIFDVGEDGGDLYMAMEYLEGRDLRAILRRRRVPLPPEQVVHIALEVARALDYAHHARDLSGRAQSIVHRDVSLANIFIGFDGRVKLIDFGIALAGKSELIKQRKNVAGNIAYMSPEQCCGEPLDGQSDVFALGIVMYELLSATSLFTRATMEETMQAVLNFAIPPLDGAPPELRELVHSALERDRGRRVASAKELAERLEELGARGAVEPATLGAYVRELFAKDSDRPDRIDPPLPEVTSRKTERDWLQPSWRWALVVGSLLVLSVLCGILAAR
jgi:serine/threonine protein kinase